MWGSIVLWFATKGKGFAFQTIKWVVIVGGIALAIYFYGHARYNQGKSEAENACKLEQEQTENKETQKVITKERTIRQYVVKTTDSDLRDIMSFWVRGLAADTEGSR